MSTVNYFNEFLLLYLLSGFAEIFLVGMPFFIAGFWWSRRRRQRQTRKYWL